MSEEQNFDMVGWWNELSFPGKELFRLEESGDILLSENNNIKERMIANISAENAAEVVKNLREKFSALEGKIGEMEVEWLAATDKLKMADKVSQLKTYIQQTPALGDFLKPALLIHTWEHTIYTLTEENYAARLKLAELAESLADSDHWKDTAQAFREIGDKWKEAGHIDRHRNDKLWNRIEAARRKFNDRKQLHHKEEEKDMLVNLDLKMEIVQKAEALASSGEWKKTTEAYAALLEQWKATGHTIHKKNEELWQRFMTAKSVFFDRKKEHYDKIQQEHEVSCAAKMAIIEKAEALMDKSDWNVTTQAFATLMEEWKKTGRVPNERGDELWSRFTKAQDHFFQRKKKHSDEFRALQEDNYQRKKLIYERAEQLKNSTHWSETTNEMQDLMEQWKKIGPVPRSYGDQMWEDFNAARKHFFTRKDAYRDQRKQQVEHEKERRAMQAKGLVGKLELEIRDEEEKIVDFKNGLDNITPGKKAAELRAHLEKLIVECGENITRLQKKLEQAKNDLKHGEHAKSAATSEVAETTGSSDPQEQE